MLSQPEMQQGIDAMPVSILVQVVREHILGLSFDGLWIAGEVSNMTRAYSGHIYFTLKDENAQIRCAMFKPASFRCPPEIQDGSAVRVQGRIDVYENRGDLQLIVHTVATAGAGDLQARFEALKAKLQAEGLFAEERKRPLPAWPATIGVVTSATGAVLHDICTVAARRWPAATILLAPTLVQGDSAAPAIVHAIRAMESDGRPQVLIVGRGGGSLEDLWPFNEEEVVRAIAACAIPIVSAVGHETDFTLADFAADLRAPTPSAAAEIVTPDQNELRASMRQYQLAGAAILERNLVQYRQRIQMIAKSLVTPAHRLLQAEQRLDTTIHQMRIGIAQQLERSQSRLQTWQVANQALSPNAVLQRGFSYVLGPDDTTISSKNDVPPTPFRIVFHDGEVAVQRIETEKTETDI